MHLRRDGIVGPHTLGAIVQRNPVPLARPIAIAPAHHVTRSTHHRLLVHIVRSGDSLTQLARRYHTSVKKLARLNHLDPSNYLLIGTKLRIPVGQHVVATTHPVAYRTTSVASVRSLIDYWALHYGVSVHLVRALAWMESGYNNALVSSVGARGIMQLLPTTFKYVETSLIGHRVRHDASGNVRAGVAYLAHLLHAFHGDKRLALAGWYQGERAVRKHGLYKVSKTFVADVLSLEHRM
jgi:LysM repeat protein